ncbi:hypothetical protein ACFYZJ_39155 [Streptomyces sp. NPDC001848]|uniref:hypothetical protein n=1 Tax=Streptomyces sp. NPDC001848 TaxID=3364618 RepID=UPI0036996896
MQAKQPRHGVAVSVVNASRSDGDQLLTVACEDLEVLDGSRGHGNRPWDHDAGRVRACPPAGAVRPGAAEPHRLQPAGDSGGRALGGDLQDAAPGGGWTFTEAETPVAGPLPENVRQAVGAVGPGDVA